MRLQRFCAICSNSIMHGLIISTVMTVRRENAIYSCRSLVNTLSSLMTVCFFLFLMKILFFLPNKNIQYQKYLKFIRWDSILINLYFQILKHYNNISFRIQNYENLYRTRSVGFSLDIIELSQV
jgi:hypothetical protein